MLNLQKRRWTQLNARTQVSNAEFSWPVIASAVLKLAGVRFSRFDYGWSFFRMHLLFLPRIITGRSRLTVMVHCPGRDFSITGAIVSCANIAVSLSAMLINVSILPLRKSEERVERLRIDTHVSNSVQSSRIECDCQCMIESPRGSTPYTRLWLTIMSFASPLLASELSLGDGSMMDTALPVL